MRQEEFTFQAATRLRQAGLRPTRQRTALAKLLFQGGDRHVTAERLHEEALENGVRISLATVYNTLNHFTAAGLLRQVAVDTTRSYFDTNVSLHHHFLNEDSGVLTDIPADGVSFSELPTAPEGTKITDVDVVVRIRDVKGQN